MIQRHAIDRLNRLATLLDRARESVRADARELTALLDDAAQMLESVGTALSEAAAAGAPDAGLVAAVARARASHAALHRVLRDQLSALGRQIAQADSGAEAAVRYAAPGRPGYRLDRLG